MNQNQRPKIAFVVIHSPGPNWKSGVDFRKQPGAQEHVMHYRKWDADGKLSLGRPFIDDCDART